MGFETRRGRGNPLIPRKCSGFGLPKVWWLSFRSSFKTKRVRVCVCAQFGKSIDSSRKLNLVHRPNCQVGSGARARDSRRELPAWDSSACTCRSSGTTRRARPTAVAPAAVAVTEEERLLAQGTFDGPSKCL